MGINRAFGVIAILAILAASTGQLPKIVRTVQIEQLKLLRRTQSASWGKAILLPAPKRSREK